jgi:hypothetical protein
VRISALLVGSEDEDNEWDDVTVFAIGPRRDEVARAAKGG